jgi:hypothetical protein
MDEMLKVGAMSFSLTHNCVYTAAKRHSKLAACGDCTSTARRQGRK